MRLRLRHLRWRLSRNRCAMYAWNYRHTGQELSNIVYLAKDLDAAIAYVEKHRKRYDNWQVVDAEFTSVWEYIPRPSVDIYPTGFCS